MRKALITGITGQDGSHLTDLLLAQGYQVFGLHHPRTFAALTPNPSPSAGEGSQAAHQIPEAHQISAPHQIRVNATPGRSQPNRPQDDQVEWLVAEDDDESCFAKIIDEVQPDEIYNLASISFVPASWRDPVKTAELMTVRLTRLLEAIRTTCPAARFFQASSSEMFGRARQTPQSESTPFQPRSPYGIAKVFGHHLAVSYRETYGLYACSGILFNHEGPRRRLEFVTRKITHTVARIRLGLADQLRLGNLQARRDWGYAGDYVRAMWLMLRQEQADDFVIGTGETHTVEEFVEVAFAHVGLDWRRYVLVDPKFYRPVETEILQADFAKARSVLGWEPKVSFEKLVRMMVDADLTLLQGTERVGQVDSLPSVRAGVERPSMLARRRAAQEINT